MRLGLIGDVHAEDDRLHIALRALAEARVDKILCTGDLADGPGDLDRACALLRDAGALVVRGAHDRWLRQDTHRDVPHAHAMTRLAPDTIAFLKTLPTQLTVDVPGGTLVLCHGVGDNDRRRLLPNDGNVAISSNQELLGLLFDVKIVMMVGGLTHAPMVRRFERGSGRAPLLVLNPGTLARGQNPGFAVADLELRSVDFFTIDEALRPSKASRSVL